VSFADPISRGRASIESVRSSPHAAGREPTLLLDCSLSLINRTGAHIIADELSKAFAESVVVRRFRSLDRPLPQGLWRKILGRMMLLELELGHAHPFSLWPEPVAQRVERVILDPLYVLRSRLATSDVVLCHDIGPITHPELYDSVTIRLYRTAYHKLRQVGPGIVFVSEASRRAFEARFGTAFRFLRVIPLYVRGGSIDGACQPVSGVAPRFFLTVGALERRKNQVTAIRAFRASGLHREGFEYVLCGARGAGADEVMALAEATPGVRLLGYVSDPELRWLYRTATAFVLPSLLEGFGMPALEAARYGLIPILSKDSALTEAVGGLGIAVEPQSTDQLASALLMLAEMDPQLRASSQEALTAHAALATRERFVEAWHDLLQEELTRGLGTRSGVS
jgi:glycosyltransferase involved in cell wall biosynthesis